MRSHNDSIDTTHTPPPLSFYNTFNNVKFRTITSTYMYFTIHMYINTYTHSFIHIIYHEKGISLHHMQLYDQSWKIFLTLSYYIIIP
jgi:hypothetical protein